MDYNVRVLHSLQEVEARKWDALANPAGLAFDPFLTHGFLAGLESSQAVTREAGWIPLHLWVEDTNNTPRAAMPLYAKTHSRGEFVFDYAWAEAFERAGGYYYPKLLAAIPFTPVTGRRFLIPPQDAAYTTLVEVLINAATELCTQQNWSSLHINFLTQAEAEIAQNLGLALRFDQQFHWQNHDYNDFEDFLAALNSAKRKNLRKERKKAQQGLEFVRLQGADITEKDWDDFYAFYLDTGTRKWGTPYLNRESFSEIHAKIGAHTLLILAKENGYAVAGALNFIGSETLYGRYWGTLTDRANLHFETCYYQAIDYAIEHQFKTVEAGAQGGHKFARGYVPTQTYSAHWIAHERLRIAVNAYLDEERSHVAEHIQALGQHTPFRKGDPK